MRVGATQLQKRWPRRYTKQKSSDNCFVSKGLLVRGPLALLCRDPTNPSFGLATSMRDGAVRASVAVRPEMRRAGAETRGVNHILAVRDVQDVTATVSTERRTTSCAPFSTIMLLT